MDSAILFGGIMFLLGLVSGILLIWGEIDINYEHLRWANEVCEVNGSVYSVDTYRVTCENGAVFRRSTAQ